MSAAVASAVTGADIRAAAAETDGAVMRAPLVRSAALSARLGLDLRLKLETMQATGSFKERGAVVKLRSLDQAARDAGVIAMSAGNHAQAVACHARRLGVAATIVMPEGAPFAKIAATRRHNAEIVLHGADLDAARDHAERLAVDLGLTFVHPYDDPAIIAGQGVIGLEMLADAPDLDTLVVPIGGGGLMAGVAIAARSIKPNITLVGVQAEAYATMARDRAPRAGGATLAEGVAVGAPGRLTRPIIDDLVDEVLVVSEPELERAVFLFAECANLVAEGAGAAGLAAVMSRPEMFRDGAVGLVVSGGNIDSRVLAQVLTRGLVRDGRLARLKVRVDDQPGALAKVVGQVAAAGASIVDVLHHRLDTEIPVKAVEIDIVVETEDMTHRGRVVERLAAANIACSARGEVD